MHHRNRHQCKVPFVEIRTARFHAVWIVAAGLLGSLFGTAASAASCSGSACGSVELLTDAACPQLRNVADKPVTVEIMVHNTIAGDRKETFELKPGQSRPARAFGQCAGSGTGSFSYQADFQPTPEADPASPCQGNACKEVALFLLKGCVYARNKGDGHVEIVPHFTHQLLGPRVLTLGPYKQMPVGSSAACLKIDPGELPSQRYAASFVLPPELRAPGQARQEAVKVQCDGNACRDLAYRMVEQRDSASGIDVRCAVATNQGARWIALKSRISAPGGTQPSGQSETMVGPGKEVLAQLIGAGTSVCAQEGSWLSVTADYMPSPPAKEKSGTSQLGEPLVRIKGKCSGTACDHVGLVLGRNDTCAWVENRGGIAVRFETESASGQANFVTTVGPGDAKRIARPTCVQSDAKSLGGFAYSANYQFPESSWRLGDKSGRDFRVQGKCSGSACEKVFLVMRRGDQCAMVENTDGRPVSFTTSYMYGFFSGTVPPGQTVLIRAKSPRGPNGCISGDEAMLKARKYEAGYIRPPNTLNNPAWHLGEPLQREKGKCEGTACAQVEILKGPNDDCVHVQNIGQTPIRVSVTRYGMLDSKLSGFDVLIPPGHLRKMPAPGGCYLATGGRAAPPNLGNAEYIANFPLPDAKTGSGGLRPAAPFSFPGR